MPGAKVVVIYPSPTDVTAFERAYTQDHAPMVTAENFNRIAELHFPSMEALQAAAASASAQRVVAHAVSISTGGTPIVLVAEETTTEF